MTMAVEELPAPTRLARARPRVARVVALLTAANVLAASGGFLTGPLLARALGPAGRGNLQAIIVPLSLVPALFCLGIPAYAFRTLPRGRRVQEILPSLGLPLLLIGLAVAAAGIPIADVLAHGRVTVRTFLIVGLLTTPLALIIPLLNSSLAALERWRGVVAMNMLPFAIPFVAIAVLFPLGDLTVATAAAATIGGSLLAVLPALPMLLKLRRPKVRLSLTTGSLDFGLKSWLGGLALTANGRLDQLLMISFVTPRQLGLYAVAVTISGAYSLLTGALSPPLMTRIASGERNMMARAVRMTIVCTVALNVAVALATPVILSLLFGPAFRSALPMALVLLAASVPLAAGSVLSAALQADGAPMIPTVGEALALIVTVAGLLVALKPLQGMGAALVSLAAYSTSFVFQLTMARRRTGIALGEFLLASRSDLRWGRDLLGGFALRLRAAG